MGVSDRVSLLFTANTSGLRAGLKKAEGSLGASAKKVSLLGGMTFGLSRAFGGVTSSILKANAVMYAARSAIRVVSNSFIQGVVAAEQFNLRVTQSAALLTSIYADSGPNLANTFEQSLDYATALQEKFVEINANTLATVKQMNLVNRELNKQGVTIDLNNKKSLRSFETLTNAIAVLTAGMQNQQMQFAQEIRSLLEGNARQGSTLALFIKNRLGKNWKGVLADWKKSGTFLENMTQYLQGFDMASGRIKKTWTAISSTFMSIVENILRKGFLQFYEVLIDKGIELNDYLIQNTDLIANKLTVALTSLSRALASVNIKALFEFLAKIPDVLKAITDNMDKIVLAFKVLIGLKVVMFIGGLATKFGLLAVQIARIGNLFAKFGIAKVVGRLGIAALAAHPVVLALAGAVAVLAGAYTILNKEAEKNTLESYTKKLEELEDARDKLIANPARTKTESVISQGFINRTDPLAQTSMQLADNSNEVLDNNVELTEEYKKQLALLNEQIDSTKASIALLQPKPSTKSGKTVYPSAPGVALGEEGYILNLEKEENKIVSLAGKTKTITEELSFSLKSIWVDMFKDMSKGLAGFISEWAKGTTTLAEVFERTFQNMLDNLREAVARFLAEEAIKALLSFFIPMFSKTPGAGVSGNLPLYRPNVGYAKGTNYVPEDQAAYLHKGEMVIPASQAADIRSGNGATGISNNMLGVIASKLDGIAAMAYERGSLIIGEEEMRVLTKAINTTNYNLGYTGT